MGLGHDVAGRPRGTAEARQLRRSWLIQPFKGRVALDDDAIINVALGALMTGQDMNNPKDLDRRHRRL